MTNHDFQCRFTTSKTAEEAFIYLLDPKNWWVGLFGETIEGSSNQVDDEFTFRAGDGMHYSNQKLIEFVPGKTIAWQVTESNLSFLSNTNEWAGTIIRFNLKPERDKTKITFTHNGLVPQIECYGSCSSAWTQYLQKLKVQLQ